MNRNRIDAENYNDLFITKISNKILEALPAAGWSAAIEDDYADLKDYIYSRDDGIAEAFTRMELVVMTPELEPGNAAGVFIHFLFHADPAKLPEDRQAFGRLLRKDNCRVLRAACEAVLHAASIKFAEPAVNVRYRPKNERISFDGNAAVNPAYSVEISYWIAAK